MKILYFLYFAAILTACSQSSNSSSDNSEKGPVATDQMKVSYDFSKTKHYERTQIAKDYDEYQFYSKKAESDEPRFDGSKISRSLSIKYPVKIVEFQGRGTGITDLTRWIQSTLVEEFGNAYVYSEKYGLDLPATFDNWVNGVNTIEDPDFIDETLLIMPWASNDQFVQFRIERTKYSGGNTDFPEIKFLTFCRNGMNGSGHLHNFDEFNPEFKHTVYTHLNQKLEELGEPIYTPDYRLSFGSEYHIEVSFEPDGITFWFPKGSVASMAQGIVNVTIPYEELRPYMDHFMIEIIDGIHDWHEFKPISLQE